MELHSAETAKIHQELFENYKKRLRELEKAEGEEKEEPFERSFLHNAIYLHSLWFEQLESHSGETSSPLLEDILKRRESNLNTYQKWMSDFARSAKPHGWAIWGWSYNLKTFVGFPIKSHDDKVPLGVLPLLVIDCWEHSYIKDFGLDFDGYLDRFWKDLNLEVIEARHQELTGSLGFGIK